VRFNTKILPITAPNALDEAAKLILSGELVAIPTETVYGLAANAFDEKAVKNIFEVKGRPSDNPLIIHTYGISSIEEIAQNIPEKARKLYETFSPGPLTIVLPKSPAIPSVTSGGLDTVGVRIPDIYEVRELIKICKVPIAAPSANLSGLPSPTSAAHVYNDLNGKIPLILDGGDCKIGLESTVITLENDDIIILRPGGITMEQLSKFGNVIIGKGIAETLCENDIAVSPGMKYKHYAPKASITVVDGELSFFHKIFDENADDESYALMFDDDYSNIKNRINFGKTPSDQAANLFKILRELDERNIKKVFARCPETKDEGLAVYNRLIRAAAFNIISAKTFTGVI
jgi:L-threonylcarbamoyladenylate synthase